MAEALDFLHVDLFQAPETLFREGEGLARSVALLAELGHPQDQIPVVHVAGTAGKGTVAAGIAAALGARGSTVGLHVSPHVYDLRERFSVDGRWCRPEEVVERLDDVLAAAAQVAATRHGPPTFFEVTLAMALVHFLRRGCDVAVIETGLGGLYDATNTVTRADKVAVITRVGLDHQRVLGHTLEAIAAQKAGILPEGGEAVVLHHGIAAVDDTVAAAAEARGCRLHLVSAPPPEPGQAAHQAEDLALVDAAVAVMDRRQGRDHDPAAVAQVVGDLDLPGRFECVGPPSGARVVLDGAHNPIKLTALIDRLVASSVDGGGSGWRWVFGCRRDKEAGAMLALLDRVARPGASVALVQFPIPGGDVPADRSADPDQLHDLARSAGLEHTFVATLDQAADFVASEGVGAGSAPTGVVAGSFALLAALRPRLGVAPWPAGVVRP